MDLPRNALHDIEEFPDLGITLMDGCRLFAHVWRPVDVMGAQIGRPQFCGTDESEHCAIRPFPEATSLHPTQGSPTFKQRPLDVDDAYILGPPASVEPRRVAVLPNNKTACRLETNMNSGETHLITEGGFGKTRDGISGLISAETAFERWSIHPEDSSSDRKECSWIQKRQQDDLCLRTENSCKMSSDSQNVYMSATIEA